MNQTQEEDAMNRTQEEDAMNRVSTRGGSFLRSHFHSVYDICFTRGDAFPGLRKDRT
ncbi:MAG: hypothetical protein RM049_17810 [Nostoc sp. DedQUE04]|uniref:hypothetical protein n=1 Tax=Nostoc sp. DedQUE04 TaxID=3075390 RepID=UPI002AD4A667|nr:hypothetical protein [Nostoc sp. DedQUE04]MDZ8137133.1 hypothetical protein [Nostoc sp. DedQUE04]